MLKQFELTNTRIEPPVENDSIVLGKKDKESKSLVDRMFGKLNISKMNINRSAIEKIKRNRVQGEKVFNRSDPTFLLNNR